MAESYKRQVRLSIIVPGTNPRRDFGDIDALASAIEATGGQPVNPPGVVADGDVYRLVDGERRVRALRKLHGEDGMADVLAFTSYDDAEEAVAMVATDTKQGLTDQERARGFQRMMLLGVEERTAAKALRRKVEDVRKAAKVALIAPEQATLDQMIAAGDFEDEADRRAVLDAGDRWASKVQSILREHERREKNAPLEAELARLGVPIVDDYSRDEHEDLESWGRWIREVETLVAYARDEDLTGAIAERYQWGPGFYIHTRKREEAEPEPSAEELANRQRVERIDSAVRELTDHLLREVATTDVMPHMAAVCGRRRSEWVYNAKSIRTQLVKLGVAERLADQLMACQASSYEIIGELVDGIAWNELVAEYLPAAIEDNYEPSEEDLWLLEQARQEVADDDE